MSDLKHTPEPWDLRKLFENPILVEPDEGGEEFYSNCFSVIDANGRVIADVNYQTDTKIMGWGHNETIEKWKANAVRIVACVNACAGIEDPEQWIKNAKVLAMKAQSILETSRQDAIDGHSYMEELHNEILALKAQRDELMEALELYMKRQKAGWMINLAWRDDTHCIMEKAIAKAKGGKP